MREIKFRMWNPETKVMVDLYKITPLAVHPDLLKGNLDGLFIPFKENYPLMQFTGLKDKNGREIYEGDIVIQDRYMWVDEGKPNYRGTVEWIYSQWQVVAHCVNPKKRGISDGINMGLNEDGYNDGEKTEWEVLGNIWENKELLLNVPSEKGE